jgi:hypothetical protein
MSDFSRTYTRSKKKKRVDEPEGDSDPIEPSGTSSGPTLRPRMSRATKSNVVDEIVEKGMRLIVRMIKRVMRTIEWNGMGKDQQMMTMMMKKRIMVEGKEEQKKEEERSNLCLRSGGESI